jgi:microsomal epoxide hydrolase
MLKSLTKVAAAGLALLLPWVATAAEKKPWKDSLIQVGDIKIHYIEAGAGERALVFIPGWTMTAEVWKEQLPYFSARGFHVFALDPRSQGQTTKTEGGNTYLQQAADLHAFLKTLKIEHAALVGWSAAVAVLLEYMSSPESLQPEKLVLVDGFPCGLKEADCPDGMTMQQARSFLLSIQEDRAKMTTQLVKSMFKSRQQETLLKDIGDASLKTPIGAALSLFFDGFTGDRRPALARVGVPTLVVVTDERRLLGESMQSKIARSKLEVVPEAGHALFLEKPQTFNQILESFLGEN